MNSVKVKAAVVVISILASLAQARPPTAGLQSPDLGKIAKSVAVITATDAGGNALPQGAGFFITGGYFATSYAVVKTAVNIKVRYGAPNTEAELAMVGLDPARVVAFLRVVKRVGPGLTEVVRRDDKESASLDLTFNGRVAAGQQVYVVAQEGQRPIETAISADGLGLDALVYPEMMGCPIIDADGGDVIGLVGPEADIAGRARSSMIRISGGQQLGATFSAGPLRDGDQPAASNSAPSGRIVGGGREDKAESSQNGNPPSVIRKSGGVLQGSGLRRAEPVYPQLAKAAQISGQVVVEIIIDEQGQVISARAISGHPLLKDTSVMAARGWLFAPTRLEGVAVKVIGTITFNFQM